MILPDLLSRRARERRLTVWSAATASGQEAYSIAMVLHERLAADPGWDVRVLASDLSEQMVRRTRGGRYSQLEINRASPRPGSSGTSAARGPNGRSTSRCGGWSRSGS